MTTRKTPTRRRFLSAAAGAGAAASLLPAPFVLAQTAKVKVGILLPYTGTYASLGHNITDAMIMAIEGAGGTLGGRPVEYVKVDSEADPAKAANNANKLIAGEKVDFLTGPVHSGVAMAMVKIAREEGTITIVSNAGADAVTRQMCAPNVFRTSFSNWQTCYPMGPEMVKRGHKKAVSITWNYAAGHEMIGAFKEGYVKAGGQVAKEILIPFPNIEFQAHLTEIASLKPDAVFTFFSGGGAVKFMKDYDAAGLKKSIPLFGAGFLTDGTLEAQGADADGLLTSLHYGDSLENAKDKSFRLAYAKAYKLQPDVYAVQGYDAAQMLGIGLAATKGDVKNKAAFAAALEKARIDSPRGAFTLGKNHNPVQDIYLRQVVGKENKVIGVASKNLSDPGRGCKM